MRRLLTLGALVAVCAAALVPGVFPPAPPTAVSARPAGRVEFRKPPPTCEQAITELRLQGQPVSCEDPPPPTYNPPEMHGSYRLIPTTYVGPLTYHDDPAPVFPVGVVSNDAEALQASPLYHPPSWLPEGYELRVLRTGDTGSEDALAALYEGPGRTITITWVHHYTWPIDVILPGSDSALALETMTVGESDAILWYPKLTSFGASHLTTALSYVEEDVEVTVTGEGLSPASAKRIALSMACGSLCLRGAGLPVPEGMSQDGDTPGGAPSNPTTPLTTAQFPSEHRVIAGLGTSSVNVSYHAGIGYWHGSSYGEAALDLTNASGGTENTNVYFISWPWSGSGAMNATTENYYTYDPDYNPFGSHCTGRYVVLQDTGQHVLGRLTYVHLTNQTGPGDSWASNANTWTIRYLGTPATSQEAGCDFHGTHLHQGQTTASPHVANNTAIPDSQGAINPTNPEPPSYNWMFRVLVAGSGDWDGDGCTDWDEAAGAPAPKPGSTGAYDPYNYWDFFDVPVGANPDPTPNGPKSRAISMGDVLAILSYVGAHDNWPPNSGGFDYDSVKDGDWNGDTIVTEAGDQVGLRYDRSPSAVPNPPWDAGPPSGSVAMEDVLVALMQVYLSCSAPSGGGLDGGDASSGEGGALDSAPNAMAVDAIPGGGVDQWRVVTSRNPFDIDVVVAAAGEPYAGYDLALTYNDQILEFVPTVDLNGDTALESWTYTGLGGMSLNAAVSTLDEDGDTALDRAAGGSARSSGSTSATGPVVTGRFRCIANGSSSVHLVGPPEGTTTLAVGGGAIDTSLADASVWCWGIQ